MSASVVEVFRAGRARRWHANPRLSWTDDYLDGHQGRVARLLLALHPAPSATLLAAALTHDDGERATSDIPGPIKAELPDGLRRALEDIEAAAIADLWGAGPDLPAEDQRWLAFCDRLDAAMWCAWHAPGCMSAEDWRATVAWLEARAVELGAGIGVRGVLTRLAAGE